MKKALDEAINDILEDYENHVITSVKEAVREVTKAALKEVKSNSPVGKSKNSGRYRKSWKSQQEGDRITASGIVYSTRPGIPHLLEFGHAKRNGGRTAPKVHIAPVQEMVEENFYRELERQL